MKNFSFMGLVRVSWEDPLKEWRACKKYFVFPKLRVRQFIRKYHEEKCAKLFELYARSMQYKEKYGSYVHEQDPYIEVTLLSFITFRLFIEAPTVNFGSLDVCYWEGMLTFMQEKERYSLDCDALWKSYKDNIWNGDDNSAERYTIKPFMTNVGTHVLLSMEQSHSKDESASAEA